MKIRTKLIKSDGIYHCAASASVEGLATPAQAPLIVVNQYYETLANSSIYSPRQRFCAMYRTRGHISTKFKYCFTVGLRPCFFSVQMQTSASKTPKTR